METLKINRKIESTQLEIEELKNWLGKEVHIIIREKISKPVLSEQSAAGILSDYKNEELIKTEKNGWIKAVKEKHGNR